MQDLPTGRLAFARQGGNIVSPLTPPPDGFALSLDAPSDGPEPALSEPLSICIVRPGRRRALQDKRRPSVAAVRIAWDVSHTLVHEQSTDLRERWLGTPPLPTPTSSSPRYRTTSVANTNEQNPSDNSRRPRNLRPEHRNQPRYLEPTPPSPPSIRPPSFTSPLAPPPPASVQPSPTYHL